MKAIYAHLLLLLCFCSACATGQALQTAPPFSVLLENAYGVDKTPKIIVIKEASALQEFYASINTIRKPGFAIPKIDFSKQHIIVLCMGEQNTAGNRMFIEKIENTPNNKIIYIKHQKSAQDMVAQVVQYPFYVAAIKATNKAIIFKKSE